MPIESSAQSDLAGMTENPANPDYNEDFAPAHARHSDTGSARALLSEELKRFPPLVVARVIDEAEKMGEDFFKLSKADITTLAHEIADQLGLDDDNDAPAPAPLKLPKAQDPDDGILAAFLKRLREKRQKDDDQKWYLHPFKAVLRGAKALQERISRFWKKMSSLARTRAPSSLSPANAPSATRFLAQLFNDAAAEAYEASSQQQMSRTAKIADKNSPDALKLMKLKSAFRPVAEHAAARLGGEKGIFKKFADKDPQAYDTLCRETLMVLEKNKGDADITAAGKQFLRDPALREFIIAQAASGIKGYQAALALINTPGPEARTSKAKKLLQNVTLHLRPKTSV